MRTALLTTKDSEKCRKIVMEEGQECPRFGFVVFFSVWQEEEMSRTWGETDRKSIIFPYIIDDCDRRCVETTQQTQISFMFTSPYLARQDKRHNNCVWLRSSVSLLRLLEDIHITPSHVSHNAISLPRLAAVDHLQIPSQTRNEPLPSMNLS